MWHDNAPLLNQIVNIFFGDLEKTVPGRPSRQRGFVRLAVKDCFRLSHPELNGQATSEWFVSADTRQCICLSLIVAISSKKREQRFFKSRL